ncbi:PH domain-containing protein [Enterococcus viikkiensis]|uniref:PH domain-containing protein n=1 Tax=Enterococcus viikkiensis TaxID=930854 RepID=UPI003F8E9371
MMAPMILGILILCNVIMAFVSALAAKPHNYVIIENTFPADKINDPQVLHFSKSYRKRQFQLAFMLSLLDLILLLPMKDSSFMLLFFLLLYLTIGANYFMMLRYIRKGHQLIIDNEWRLPTQPIQIDTKLVLNKNRKLVSPWWFLLTLGLNLLFSFLLYRQELGSLTWILLVTNLSVWLTLLVTWCVIRRLPVRSMTDDQNLNQQYNDLTKFYWSSLSVFLSVILSVLIYVPLLTTTINPNYFTLLMVVEFILIFFFCGSTIWWLLRLRQKQDQLLTQSTTVRYSGDDYYWRYGIYYNPDDRRLMIPDRIGMNISVNLGRIGGKIFMGLLPVILVIATLVAVVPLYVLDYHPDPLTYELKNETLLLDGPFIKKQTIPLNQIEDVALINQLPTRSVRTSGLATNDYATGYFRMDGKSSVLLIDHSSKPILKLGTKKRDYFYTNKQPAKTKKLYQEIKTEK